MTRAAIGLGSNLGERESHLTAALVGLAAVSDVVSVSSIYETAPVGGPEQGPYLNAVAVVDTALPASALLEALLATERARGRKRRERWGPRTLDLDLLLYGDAAIERPGLVVPHPRLIERRFVVDPLVEAWPDAALPDGTRVADVELAGDPPLAVFAFPAGSWLLAAGSW